MAHLVRTSVGGSKAETLFLGASCSSSRLSKQALWAAKHACRCHTVSAWQTFACNMHHFNRTLLACPERVTMQGDSFLIAFHTPKDALQYCLAVQLDLLQAPWPEELLADAAAAADAGYVHLQCSNGTMAW